MCCAASRRRRSALNLSFSHLCLHPVRPAVLMPWKLEIFQGSSGNVQVIVDGSFEFNVRVVVVFSGLHFVNI